MPNFTISHFRIRYNFLSFFVGWGGRREWAFNTGMLFQIICLNAFYREHYCTIQNTLRILDSLSETREWGREEINPTDIKRNPTPHCVIQLSRWYLLIRKTFLNGAVSPKIPSLEYFTDKMCCVQEFRELTVVSLGTSDIRTNPRTRICAN